MQAQCVRRNRLLLIALGHEHKLFNLSGVKPLDYSTIATGGAEWDQLLIGFIVQRQNPKGFYLERFPMLSKKKKKLLLLIQKNDKLLKKYKIK